MSTESTKVWETLLHADIVQGDEPKAADTVDSPWYVKVLLAISGWLAALFLLGFIGLGFRLVFRSEATSVIVGCMLVGAAFALLRMPKNEFYEHVALAISLAGQALITWPIFDSVNAGNSWLLMSMFQLLLALLMPNYIHRAFSSFIAAFCFSMALTIFGMPYIAGSVIMLAAAWLWLHEFDYPKHMQKQRAIGYGLVLALIQVKGSVLYQYSFIDWFGRRRDADILVQPWVGELLAGVVTLYVVWHILRRLGLGLSEPITIAAMIGTVLLAAASMEAHGITVGMLVILLGFAGSNRVLMGLGIISLLFYISSYYYQLHATLLDKSITLLSIWLVLFVARWLMLRVAAKGGEVQHG